MTVRMIRVLALPSVWLIGAVAIALSGLATDQYAAAVATWMVPPGMQGRPVIRDITRN